MKPNCSLKKNRNNKECLRKARKKFPLVMKNSRMETISIVYARGVEDYKLQDRRSKSQIDKENEGKNVYYEYEESEGKGWNPFHEVQVLKDNGWKQIQNSESIIWED